MIFAGDPGEDKRLDGSFYEEINAFVRVCRKTLPSMEDCRLFIDPEGRRGYLNKADIAPLRQFPRPQYVLEELKNALESLGPGDRVVFSLYGHGAPGLVHPSCVYLHEDDPICASDVD